MRPLFSGPDNRDSSVRVIRWFKSYSEATGIILVLLGGLVLVGWWLRLEVLKSGIPGWRSTKPVTALTFILAGVSLWLLRRDPRDSSWKAWPTFIGRFCAALVSLIGFLGAVDHVFGAGFGADQLFAKGAVGVFGPAPPGRMGLATAVDFFFLGCALLLLDFETRRGRRPAQYLALIAAFISLPVLVSLGDVLTPFYSVTYDRRIGLITSLGIVLLILGVLCARPDRGLMASLTSNFLGGRVARRLLPVAILIPVALGCLGLLGERAGLFHFEFGLGLWVTSITWILVSLVWWTIRYLNEMDAAYRDANEKRLQSEETYRLLFKKVPYPMWISDLQTLRFLEVNDAAIFHYGYVREEFLSMTVRDIRPSEDVPRLLQEWARIYSFPGPAGLWRHCKKGGSLIDVEITAVDIPWSGKLCRLAVAQDVTERRRTEQKLQEQAACLAAVTDESPLPILTHDLEGRVIKCNEAFERLFQYRQSEIEGGKLDQFTSWEESKQESEGITSCILSGKMIRLTTTRRKKDGQFIEVELTALPLKIRGKVQGGYRFYQDITERKELEELGEPTHIVSPWRG
jgi:PAS domain S-box-containing protein